MKRWVKGLVLGLALGACTVARAEGPYNVQVVSPFGTLNNTDSPLAVSGAQAQDLLNVDIAPQGKSVKTRKGYATAYTLAIATSGVHGTHFFYQSGGSDISLFANDYRLNASVAGASPTVLFSTGSNGATYQCIDSGGFAYCANTGRTSLVKTDGTISGTTSITSVNSTGTLVAVTQERLVTSGFLEAPNRIDFSQKNNFANWVVGGFSYDPIQWTIAAPGSRITHIVFAHGRIYWFKESSYGYILEGPEHGDWVVKVRSTTIGTLYNTSIVKDDMLYFQGQDGHFYSDDGSTLTRMSRDIQGTIDVTQARIPGAWTQTTSSEFDTGSYTNTTSTDTSGSVSLSFVGPSVVHSRPSGIAVSDLNGAIFDTCAGGGVDQCVAPYYQSSSFTVSSTFFLKAVVLPVASDTSTDPNAYGHYMRVLTNNAGAPGTVLGTALFPAGNYSGSPHITTCTFTGTIVLTTATIYWMQLYEGTDCTDGVNAMKWYGTGTVLNSTQSYCGSGRVDKESYFLTMGSTYPTSGTYVSAVHNSPSLTSWDSLQATKLDTNGTHTFSIRAATGVFSVGSSTPVWSSISSGAIPTVSTGSYFQIRDVLTTGISTATPVLYDFTQNWFEGGATDKTYACYNDNALLWSVASGTGATTNNKILKYDLINQGWLIYDIPTNGMFVRNQRLYLGSPTTGTIYKFGDATSDNGVAINSYWKSRDFFGTDPFTDKEYWRMAVASKGVANSSMTVTYQLNGNTSTSITIPTTESSDTVVKRNVNLPLSTVGSVINVKFGNNAVDQPFEVFGSQIEYSNKSWKPEDN